MPALLHESDFTLLNPDNHPSSPSLADAVAFALQKYPGFNFLPSNYDSIDTHLRNASPATAHFSCDDFRMYEFKVRRCMRGRSHDWTECPFAHPGEKARRRDPRRIHYSGAPCPDFRKGSCRRGDACEFAHGVFECWLHPARYRTQVCKDGKNCKRRVCFFAHSPEQLRILPSSPSSTHAHSETGDRSPVGSPGSFLSQHNYSLEIPSSPSVVGSAGSTSKYLMTDGTCMPNAAAENNCIKGFSSASTMLPSPSSNLAASNTYMSHPTHEVSPISMHYLDSLNAGSPLRRAMAQSFLAGKSYSGASFGLNVPNASITEYPPAYDTFGPLCTSPQSHLGSCNSKLREAKLLELSLPLGSLENSHSYEFSSYSHGFASPTSTLAGHTFSPPPLSPPLSPLSSPNPTNCQHKGSFTNSGHSQLHNFYVDDTTYRGSTTESFRNYTDCMEDLAFRLQQLQVPETFEPMGFPLQINSHESARHGMLENAPLKSPPSKLSSLGRIAHGISCTPEQSMWSPLNQNSSKDHNIDLLLSDASTQEMMVKICGEESFGADNVIPDFGWVSELVK